MHLVNQHRLMSNSDLCSENRKVSVHYRSCLLTTVFYILLLTTQFEPIPCTFEDSYNSFVKIHERSHELIQAINVQRQEHMRKQCQKLGYTNQTADELTEEQMDHMIIDRKHKFLYCYAPKVACTNWKRVLMILTGLWQNGTNPLQIPGTLVHSTGIFEKFNQLTMNERSKVFSDYTRLIIVRHPFERLLSAYRNKLKGTSLSARYFQERVGKLIVKSLRPNASNHSLEYGDDVNFKEFVLYLLDPVLSLSNQSSYNEHWQPITDLCNPCIMQYNVIGKYETLLDDSSLALYLTRAENITFPAGHKPSDTRSQLRTYLDSLPVTVLRRLYEIYVDDFRLFNYDLNDVLGFELS